MIQTINDWFFSIVDRYMDFHYGDLKRKLLADHPDTMVEIGAAYGANFRYMRPGSKLIVIEPDKSFNELLQRRAKQYGIEVEVHNYGAEKMSLKSDSVDMIIGTLVLCSVEYPEKVLDEIGRVMNENGKYVYLEHIRADKHTLICKIQKLVKTPWKWFFDGCHVNRKTDELLNEAQFSRVKMEQFDSKTIFIPIIPHICGVAMK